MDAFMIFAAVMYSLVVIAACVAVLTVDKWSLPKWLRPQRVDRTGFDAKPPT